MRQAVIHLTVNLRGDVSVKRKKYLLTVLLSACSPQSPELSLVSRGGLIRFGFSLKRIPNLASARLSTMNSWKLVFNTHYVGFS